MITREMTIESILTGFPGKAQKLTLAMSKAGLQCASCDAATWETLEAGMLSHGMNDEQIDGLVADLNAILKEKGSDPASITLTKAAADKYRTILASEGKEGWGLRFGEKAAGCSGFEYDLNYSEKAQEGDRVFESEGIEIHVAEAFVDRLIGSEVDYIDGLFGSGFKVTNPNVNKSCGCGSSHGY